MILAKISRNCNGNFAKLFRENLCIYFREILRNSKQFRQNFVFREILKMLFRSHPSCNVNPDSGIGTKLHESNVLVQS